jgi:hypothetical protein
LCAQYPQKTIAVRADLLYFSFAMQEPDQNADDVAASERARQRAKKTPKSHGGKKPNEQ